VAGAAPVDGPAVHGLADALGWPVLAEPRSRAWIPAATAVVHLDAILRSHRAADGLRPEVVLRIGAPGASRVVNEWLAASGAVEVVVGAPGWSDPAATAATVVDGPPAGALAALRQAVAGPAPRDWQERWRAASDAAATAVAATLARESTPNEPAIARDVVVDNDGGGIFSFLPQARALPTERFETLFGTPHGLDLVAVAAAFGVDARALGRDDQVGGAVREAIAKGGVHVLVARTDRAANIDVHGRIDDAVAAAVDAALT
jgi:2-succinyl-5-enolpyruvyl-6-hydroxy-3-cyclohexene-1-carboxylate synthase